MDLSRVFKAYDVRGVVPDELDADLARLIGAAFATWSGASEILIGRDCRLSSPELASALTEGATSLGVDVIDLGLASTDLLYFASGSLDRPGVMITASHNPKEYNGLKFCLAGAKPVGEESGLGEIRALTEKGEEILGTGHGSVRRARRARLPTSTTCSRSPTSAEMRPLTVAVDTANGMGGLVVPAVMERLPGHACITSTPSSTGRSRTTPPIRSILRTNETSSGWSSERRADVGMAFDGDADRVFLVDERAEDVSGSLLTALIAAAMLEREPGAKVVHNVICSWTVPEVIRENGGEPIRARVGHSFIKQVMAETGAIFGGEHSGHYYFRDNYGADSGLIAAVMTLGELSKSERTLSQLLAAVPAIRLVRRDQLAGGRPASEDRGDRGRAPRRPSGPARRADGRVRRLVVQRSAVQHRAVAALNVEAKTPELLAAKTEELLALIRGEEGRRGRDARRGAAGDPRVSERSR